jgi:lactoylglutathione lyase
MWGFKDSSGRTLDKCRVLAIPPGGNRVTAEGRRAMVGWMPLGHCKREEPAVRYLHTMLRVRNLDDALDFYCNKLGLKEVRRRVDEKNRYTLVFLAGPEDEGLVEESKRANGRDAPLVELTYNWDSEDYGEARFFGHLAYEVDDIYATCDKLMKAGVTINRPPRDGNMAFVRSPDKHSIELLQKGNALPPQEPWKSMPNSGKW